MSKQIVRRISSILICLTLAAPVVCVAQTGTDPEPTDPGNVIQVILTILSIA